MIMPSIKHDLVWITPERAKDLLELNTNNRRINNKKVAQYVRDMNNDNFEYNGHTICVSKANVLLDGQQRLTACVQSGKPFWSILVQGLEDSVMATIDSGRARVYSDRLKIRGIPNATAVAATLTHVCLLAQRTPKNAGLTASQLDGVIEKHPEIAESAGFTKNTFPRCDSILGAIHYVAKYTGYEEAADQFVRSWKDGQMNYDNCPIHYVRELVYKDATKLKKMTTVHKSRLILLSWNKFKDSQPLRNAKVSKHEYRMDGWDKEVANLI